MAKKNTAAQAQTEIETLKASLAISEAKRNELGSQALSFACLLREKFVKNLSKETFDSVFGTQALAFLTYIESVKPSVVCLKCSGCGVVEVKGSYLPCFGCVVSRSLTGKGGMAHYVDQKVQAAYQASRFGAQGPRQTTYQKYEVTSEEIAACQALKARKTTAPVEADITF